MFWERGGELGLADGGVEFFEFGPKGGVSGISVEEDFSFFGDEDDDGEVLNAEGGDEGAFFAVDDPVSRDCALCVCEEFIGIFSGVGGSGEEDGDGWEAVVAECFCDGGVD